MKEIQDIKSDITLLKEIGSIPKEAEMVILKKLEMLEKKILSVYIADVFKKHPNYKPNQKGVNYLTLVEINGNICYSITYFNEDAVFETKIGKVVAFSEKDPKDIFNAL